MTRNQTNFGEGPRQVSNRHPVDALADAKQAMDEAKALYDAARNAVLALGASQRQGDEFEAHVTEQTRTALDRDAVKAMLTPAQFDRCLNATTAVVVKISRKAPDIFG